MAVRTRQRAKMGGGTVCCEFVDLDKGEIKSESEGFGRGKVSVWQIWLLSRQRHKPSSLCCPKSGTWLAEKKQKSS